MSRDTGATCTICQLFFQIWHSHHTIPRSRGGEDSQQIPLCASCHNTLHANGVAVVARIKGSKKPVGSFWATPEQERRAKPYLEILVKALLLPVVEGYEAQHPLHFSVDTEFYEQIKLLQQDLGATSIRNTIVHSIQRTLYERGLGNVAAGNREARKSSELWFMRKSKS